MENLLYEESLKAGISKSGNLFKVTPNLHVCLPEKNSYARCFLGNHYKLYIDKKVIKCRIDKIISYFSYILITSLVNYAIKHNQPDTMKTYLAFV